jgi:hypothetical protein
MLGYMRRFLVIPIALLGLSIAFIVLSVILVITKGSDPVLRKKLRIGGLILALQGVAVQGAWSGPARECYARAEPEFEAQEMIEVNLAENPAVEAVIRFGWDESFSYAIYNQDRQLVQEGELPAADGEIDAEEEAVIISLDPARFSDGGLYILEIRWQGGTVATHPLIVRIK